MRGEKEYQAVKNERVAKVGVQTASEIIALAEAGVETPLPLTEAQTIF